MGDNPKERGARHMRNKAKFNKHKSRIVNNATPRSKSPATLGSNWNTYEGKDDLPPGNYTSIGEDFALLANAPISKGSHFQFKSNPGDDFFLGNATSDTTGLFNLDLNLLALSIASIPFNERCGIPDNYFTATQHHFMKQTAKNSAELYEQSLLKLGYQIDGFNEKEIFSHREHRVNSSHPHTDKNVSRTPKKKKLSSVTGDSPIKENINDKLKANSERTNQTEIDNLHNLEEEFALLKQDMKDIEDSPVQSKQIPEKCSGDFSIYRLCDDSKDSTTTKDSSLLETESLEEWLDDVLEN